MTKLIIQIPCFNEAENLPATLAELPRRIAGIDTIEHASLIDAEGIRLARERGYKGS